MLESLNIETILFLDIETVPQFPDYDSVPEHIKPLWNKKSESLIKNPETETPKSIYPRAGIYAEFGKVICISVGYINGKEFRVKSFASHDEAELLSEFISLVNKHFNRSENLLCAHNGKEFDFPYLARRILINGLKLPRALDTAGKKPWEIQHLDTMELWKFGDYKNFTSLNLLASIFNIPTPKDDIDGSKVYEVYWQEKNLERIVTYCNKDVLTVAQILLRMRGEPLIEPDKVFIV
ncbi:MAG: 3'-5' exonuclease [Ignavibacteriae bacterium]|nr:3'-5' exonuclease [Ignavibacteriota bacterium]